jgi:hypothetical protein
MPCMQAGGDKRLGVQPPSGNHQHHDFPQNRKAAPCCFRHARIGTSVHDQERGAGCGDHCLRGRVADLGGLVSISCSAPPLLCCLLFVSAFLGPVT